MTYSVHYCIHPLLSYVMHTKSKNLWSSPVNLGHSAGEEVLVRVGKIALVLYLEMKTLHLNFLSFHQ